MNIDMNELIDFIKQWQSNPLHWTNNKRRMHGYAPLRQSLNSKKRFYPDKFILFSLIQDAIAKEMPDLINRQIEQFADIKNWKSNQ